MASELSEAFTKASIALLSDARLQMPVLFSVSLPHDMWLVYTAQEVLSFQNLRDLMHCDLYLALPTRD